MRTLITGCSTGIGRATAVELTKRGHDVIATARRLETLEDLDVAQTLALDVTDEASVTAAIREAGAVDVLVNNAGVGLHGPVESVPLDEVKRLFETNVHGAVRMLQAVLPQMRERGRGVVVNVSSVAGRVTAPLGAFYSATKYALEAVSEGLHYEVGHFGIRVRIVEPGGFETRFGDNRRSFGVDKAPYDELDEQWAQASARLGEPGAQPPGPELVAQTIADAIESDEPKLRWPVGADAEMVLGVRAQHDDETFEATMREVLELTW